MAKNETISKFLIPLLHVNGGLDLLNQVGQDPDAVVDGPVHARLQLVGCVRLHLLELCCFKLVLADHQRAIQPFLELGHLSLNNIVGRKSGHTTVLNTIGDSLLTLSPIKAVMCTLEVRFLQGEVDVVLHALEVLLCGDVHLLQLLPDPLPHDPLLHGAHVVHRA